MANDTTTTAQAGQDQVPPVTWGERLAGVAGVITATAILLICLDMALGGRLCDRVTARTSDIVVDLTSSNPRRAEDGGCGC